MPGAKGDSASAGLVDVVAPCQGESFVLDWDIPPDYHFADRLRPLSPVQVVVALVKQLVGIALGPVVRCSQVGSSRREIRAAEPLPALEKSGRSFIARNSRLHEGGRAVGGVHGFQYFY